MIEIVLRIARHPEFFHHAPRAPVLRHGERDDLLEPGLLEAEFQRRHRALGRVAQAPMIEGQPVSQLNAGREGSLEARHRETDEADERSDARNFDRPEAESVLREVLPDLRRERIALRAIQRRRQELHDAGVRVEGREGLEVGVAPLPQHELLRPQGCDAVGFASSALPQESRFVGAA
jgi:hypothetical protein